MLISPNINTLHSTVRMYTHKIHYTFIKRYLKYEMLIAILLRTLKGTFQMENIGCRLKVQNMNLIRNTRREMRVFPSHLQTLTYIFEICIARSIGMYHLHDVRGPLSKVQRACLRHFNATRKLTRSI